MFSWFLLLDFFLLIYISNCNILCTNCTTRTCFLVLFPRLDATGVTTVSRDFKIGHYSRLGRLERCHVTQNTRRKATFRVRFFEFPWAERRASTRILKCTTSQIQYKVVCRSSSSVIEPSAKGITSEFRTWLHRPLLYFPILYWKFSRLPTVMTPGCPSQLTVVNYLKFPSKQWCPSRGATVRGSK